MPQRLAIPADVAAALARVGGDLSEFALDLHWYGVVGSTNDVAAQLAAAGAAHGTVVVAEAQTSGRGRLGRSWFSPPGAGLYVSVVLRPGGGASPPAAGSPPGGSAGSLLTLMAGVAVAEGVERATGLRVGLKWPNDLVIEAPAGRPRGARRKLAGILAEGATAGSRLEYVILGVGINLRPSAFPPELTARVTSLEDELGRPVDTATVLAECLAGLARGWRTLAAGRQVEVVERWRERGAGSFGQPVAWQGPAGVLEGTTRGLDDGGALLVDRAGGVERIVAGEVTWR